MSKQEDESKHTSRRNFTKSMAAAIAIVPFGASRISVQGKMTQEDIAKLGKTGAGQKRGIVVDDSPITVGGGGGGGEDVPKKFRQSGMPAYVYLEKLQDYPDTTGGGPKKKIFRNDDFVMKSITVVINTDAFDLSSLLTDDGACKIKVNLKGGGDHELIIFCNLNETGMNGMGVKFHTGKYLRDSEEPVYLNRDSYSTNFIKSLSVITNLGSFERQGLTAGNMVGIKVGLQRR